MNQGDSTKSTQETNFEKEFINTYKKKAKGIAEQIVSKVFSEKGLDYETRLSILKELIEKFNDTIYEDISKLKIEGKEKKFSEIYGTFIDDLLTNLLNNLGLVTSMKQSMLSWASTCSLGRISQSCRSSHADLIILLRLLSTKLKIQLSEQTIKETNSALQNYSFHFQTGDLPVFNPKTSKLYTTLGETEEYTNYLDVQKKAVKAIVKNYNFYLNKLSKEVKTLEVIEKTQEKDIESPYDKTLIKLKIVMHPHSGWVGNGLIFPEYAQGWKLHISASSQESAIKILDLLYPTLKKMKSGYKVPGNSEHLSRILTEEHESQSGKFITIYPVDDHNNYSDENALELVRDIDKILQDALKSGELQKDDFQKLKYEKLLGQSGGLSTRYGSFSNDKLEVLDENGNPTGQYVPDDREGPYKPFFIKKHPFGDLLKDD